jgi:hypothetical protein
MIRKEMFVWSVVSVLAIVAVALIVTQPPPSARSVRFHQLVGGLGFGTSISMETWEFGFDPRLGGGCSCDCGHIPGAMCFCPEHAGRDISWEHAETESDAGIP